MTDEDGNIGIQGSFAVNDSTSDSGMSIGLYQTITNAPELDDLDGYGAQIGGSYGYNGMVLGADYSFIPDSKAEKCYGGLTTTLGFGTPGFEIHGGYSYSKTVKLSDLNLGEIGYIIRMTGD